MKKAALPLAALALTVGSALAADLPARKGPAVSAPPPPPPPAWTGFYVGLNAGATWANSSLQSIGVGPVAADPNWIITRNADVRTANLLAFSSAASASGSNSNNVGFIGGGQIGYNYQFLNNLVVGFETDIQGVANNSGSRAFGSLVPTGYGDSWVADQTARGNLQYLGTARGRLGWLVTPTFLLYGTGGLAYGGLTLNSASSIYKLAANGNPDPNIAPAFGGVNYSGTQVGWTAGGGIEWLFIPNWSAKVEYLYYDLGSVTQRFGLVSTNLVNNNNGVFGGEARARVNGNLIRAGVNYHFNWGSTPVVAKY